MRLDDIESVDAPRVEAYLAKVKVLRRVARHLIDFLAQLEDFQKRLWLKKKFVVDTQYCITLDRIPEEFYPEIAASEAQREEWVRLFAIDELDNYSAPLKEEFLANNQTLLVNTSLFSADFRDRLVSELEELDETTEGTLVRSENSQGLRLLLEKRRKSIHAIYIDPPYNTVHSEIAYKNDFKHSSWLSLIRNGLEIVPSLWADTFSFGAAIDDYEHVRLATMLRTEFPTLEHSTVIVNHHPQGSGGRLSRTHEYYLLASPSSAPQYLGEPKEDDNEDRSFMRSGSAENNFRYGRWRSFYALLRDPNTGGIVDAEPPVPLGEDYPTGVTDEGLIRIYPINSRGEERVWRSSYETGKRRARNGELFASEAGTVYQAIDHNGKRETLFSNWTDKKYNTGIHGTNLLSAMGLGGEFDYPKSPYTMVDGL
nr:DNA methyltransferase [Paracoccus bogoriensis]